MSGNIAIKTRFAPSPTGNLHIGGARTALYSYLWAKKMGGQFFLRIEDTDQTRYQATAEQSIYDGLHWLGLEWEDGVMRQSSRTEIYRQHAKQLLEMDKAYYCFCTAERLELMRDIQRKKNRAPKYDKTCLRLTPEQVQHNLEQNLPHVVRLNIPETGSVVVNDLVRGKIEFQFAELDDQILLKSDNFPTYHLANVVDDHEMQITHVIRGEEWIPSTPKHVFLYQAFGWVPPEFAHLSLFINKGGGKMSKREGAQSVLAYRDAGYLPAAVINFIAFLGWNPKTTQEMFSLPELIAAFDLHNINTANPIFDTEKLDWYNGQYIRQLSIEQLAHYCQSYLPAESKNFAPEYIQSVIELEQERLQKFSDITALTNYFFTETLNYEPSLLVWKKSTPELTKQNLQALYDYLQGYNQDWTQAALEQNLLVWIKEHGYGNGDILWPLRTALSGTKASPPPFALAAILGKDRTLQRVQAAIKML